MIAGRMAAAIDIETAEQLVTDVRIGLRYAAVELGSGRVGAPFTFRESVRDCCCAFQGMHPLSSREAQGFMRVSFEKHTREEDVDVTVRTLVRTIGKLRAVSSIDSDG